jgi:hypothetical protein
VKVFRKVCGERVDGQSVLQVSFLEKNQKKKSVFGIIFSRKFQKNLK